MDATGWTKPLDLEEAYRRAVEDELRAIRAIEPTAAEPSPVTNPDAQWARAIAATERAAALRRALDIVHTE